MKKHKYVCNPIFDPKKRDQDWGDPVIWILEDGGAISIATASPTKCEGVFQPRLQMAYSPRGLGGKWKIIQEFFPPSWAEGAERMWAPSLSQHPDTGKWLLEYCVDKKGEGMALGVMTADHIMGPYTDLGYPVKSSSPDPRIPSWANIDSQRIYVKGKKGKSKALIASGSGHEPIRIQPVRKDGTIDPDEQGVVIAFPNTDKYGHLISKNVRKSLTKYEHLLEGVYVLYHPKKKRWYAFISAGTTHKYRGYAVVVYTAEDWRGPWIRSNIALEYNKSWGATGQIFLFQKGGKGPFWAAYHAASRNKKRRRMPGGGIPRVLMGDRVHFGKDKVLIGKGSPTSGPQKFPR